MCPALSQTTIGRDGVLERRPIDAEHDQGLGVSTQFYLQRAYSGIPDRLDDSRFLG